MRWIFALLCCPLLVALWQAVDFNRHHRNNGTMISSGEEREYLLYVPASYDGTEPTPLVMSFHGGALRPSWQRDFSGWNALADRYGFIVVYPAGLRIGGSGPRGWRVNERGPDLAKDVRFISDLIDDLERQYAIDSERIYANGLSNGGGMSVVLSCTLSHRMAAVGLVAGAYFLPFSWCAEQGLSGQKPMPMIAFHGTADEIVPYEGGSSWVKAGVSFPAIPEWTAQWAQRNRCDPKALETAVTSEMTRRDYKGCAGGASVVLFTLDGDGHTWPGSEPIEEWFLGRTSSEIDATSEMWSFFQDHPKVFPVE